MNRHGLPLRVCLTVLFLLLAHCTAAPKSLRGFPLHEMDQGPEGVQASADAILDDLDRIEGALEATAPSPPRGPGVPLRTEALRVLLDVHLSLSAEWMSYQEPPQLQEPPYPPIVLHPRLTAPALVEPKLISHEGAVGYHWVIPIVLDKKALYWDLSADSVWFGKSPSRNLYNDPAGHVAAFLVPHGEAQIDQRRPIALASFFHRIDPLEVGLSDGSTVSLPDLLPGQVGVVLALPVSNGVGVTPGFKNLQFFPKVPVAVEALRTAWGRRLGEALLRGDWYEARATVRAFPGARHAGGASAIEHDLVAVAEGIDAFLPTRFDPQLDPIRRAFQRWSWLMPDPKHLDSGPTYEILRQLTDFVRRSHQPVPVLLDEPGQGAAPFSFIAAGDLQFHEDRSSLDRFLRLIDADGDGRRSAEADQLAPEIRARLRDVKFVVIAGDLGDGEGLSSKPSGAIVAGLGLTPPLSPYRKEFPTVRRELEACRVPVFAVPGNHDGFAAYGGLLNSAFDIAGEILKAPPEPLRLFTHPVGHGLQEIGQYLPTLVKVGRLSRHPYFDGLVRWQFEFGPLNSAFTYRGCSFLAFNSYHLPALYRDQVGPIANNWGGGVEPEDALWFDVNARWQKRRSGGEGWEGHQFVFMHHDPRAAVPDPRGSGKEIGYGQYDSADAPFNALTFGWLGTDYSTLNPLFLPIITPVGTNLWRLASTGDRFNQEWMGTAWGCDTHCHSAESLVSSINAGLARDGRGGGISHVFFAHNDEPAEGTWAERGTDGVVFRPPPGRAWTGHPYGSQTVLEPFAKVRTQEPFPWGVQSRAPVGRNAEVHRVDDLGDNGSKQQGFHLVTVYPNPRGRPAVVATPVLMPKAASTSETSCVSR